MKKLNVELNSESYPVFIGNSIVGNLPALISRQSLYSNILIILDESINKFYSDRIKKIFAKNKKVSYYILKKGEKSKSHSELNKIYSYLIKNSYGRDSLVAAFGGGVTGDLAAYAASTFMRGIQVVHVPTTLLAMVDSAIGGKTGINFDNRKNMIGTFYQPKFVLIDPEFLKTLPKGEVTSGIGEIVKYAFLSDKKFFKYVEENLLKIYDFDPVVTEELIIKSDMIKAGVVSHDEKESGLRKILNLGHTFAHAFESNLNFKVKHGEAVIAGVIAALCLSYKMKFLKKEKFEKYIPLPLKIKLNKKLQSFDINEVYEIMHSDKKNRGGKIKFVLLSDVGKLLIDIEASKANVYWALNKTKELLAGN